MGAGDIISPGNQILALTAKKAIPKSATIAKGKIFVLIKPKDWIKATKMAFAGLKNAEDRAAVILYMNENSSNPLQLQ